MSDAPQAPIEIRITEAGHTVEITAWVGEVRAGVLVMSRLSPHRLLIDHTQTFTGFEGRGLGKRLVVEAAEWARANGQQLMPLCPFARQILDRLPEYADVRTGL